MKMSLSQMARIAAKNHINNLSPIMKVEFTGDRLSSGTSSVIGFSEEIMEAYYEEYADKKPTIELLEEIAGELL